MLNYPDYIKYNKPVMVYWKVVTGPALSVIQDCDLVFDKIDEKLLRKHVANLRLEIP